MTNVIEQRKELLKSLRSFKENDYVCKLEEAKILEYLANNDTYFKCEMDNQQIELYEVQDNVENDTPIFTGSKEKQHARMKIYNLEKEAERLVKREKELEEVVKVKNEEIEDLDEKLAHSRSQERELRIINEYYTFKIERYKLIEAGFGEGSPAVKALDKEIENMSGKFEQKFEG